MPTTAHALVLASSSPFRQELLSRLTTNFISFSPDIDETARQGESHNDLAGRLALQKAQAGAPIYRNHLIIGSDQVAVCREQRLGKPGNAVNARAQLTMMSGQRVTFYTGLCLLNSTTGQHQLRIEEYRVHFRSLSATQISNYLARETPYGCAGSFQSEALGIALCQGFEGRDPTALIGLPLMALVEMLEQESSPVI
ncbi:MAG: Maf family nucleotide pyrophosphatase [Gammaproteobacteria bacterium]|nr:Maf family nucleotide pyrophosphatase [Gammaproteobacteria bacterium]